MGTINLLEIVRKLPSLKKFLIFTSDKVYRNTNKKIYYKEDSEIGGLDPYSASKSCQDLISRCYSINYHSRVQVTIIRSGNIIGNDGIPFINELNSLHMKDLKNYKISSIRTFEDDILETRKLFN